ncbi:MAG TPA: hypothetical protein VFA15_01875, partial [Nitrososphaera sp.]|nr:hypothetical protein [Nitrososphaera sp.]
MNLEQWCRIDEQIYIAESDERFMQYAGLEFSENAIEKLATIKSANASLFLESFDSPRELYLSALESIADSETKGLELRLNKLRNERISTPEFKFAGSHVNWSTWRQFN